MQLFLLVLLILVAQVAMVAAVAGCQSDRDKDHRPRKNCTAAGFSDVPAGFEPTTKVLLFPNNLFSSLSWSSFQDFTEIYEIDLTANKVPVLTPSVAPILPSLSVLRLGSNRLTSLPAGSFSACPALTELYLENNIISSLSDGSFNGLSKLEILDLTSNHIKVLPDLMLHPLVAIETIYLESNKIRVMPDDWFSKKEEVPYLFLSANPWACSCTLGYLYRYLEDYEFNVYVRDGPIISSDVDSVVCDSPMRLKDKPVMSLKESDFCSTATESGPTGVYYQQGTTHLPDRTTATAPINPTPTAAPAPTTPSPPTTTTTTTTTTTAAAAPTFSTTPAFVELSTEYHRVVTWYQTFTRTLLEWSDHSETEEASVELQHSSTHSTFTTSTEDPTKPAPVAVASTELPTTAESIPSQVPSETSDKQLRSRVAAAGVFCVWLFAGCFLLSAVAAACAAATLARLVVWYRRVYRPLVRRRGGRDGVMLVTYSKTEQQEEEATGGGVTASYRSVLFVHRDGGNTMAMEGNAEERGVYRKTLYRLQSREEEVAGRRDIMEECGVSVEDGGRRGGASRKRYSVILREEREEARGGREGQDWVVGGWEVTGGGQEELRSSWGEWLTQYLPSMPWGVATPPGDKAAQ